MRKNFLNEAVCAQCGGRCCKSMPGECHPDDFEKINKNMIKALLESGDYAVDWWEGDPRPGENRIPQGYYLRPSTTLGKKHHRVFDPSWGGECVFLSKSGCVLSPEDRPWGCRMLEPNPDKATRENPQGCKTHAPYGFSKQAAAVAWLPYRRIFRELRREF